MFLFSEIGIGRAVTEHGGHSQVVVIPLLSGSDFDAKEEEADGPETGLPGWAFAVGILDRPV